MINIYRYDISRHLKGLIDVDIVNDPRFRNSKDMFVAVCKLLKQQGLGSIDHHPPVSPEDMIKLYDYMCSSLDDATTLQQKVLVDLLLHQGRRGRENIHLLKVSDFAVTTDAQGNCLESFKTFKKT